MRGLRNITNQFRRVGEVKLLAAGVFVMGLSVLGALGVFGPTNTAYASNPDNDIVRGGIYGRDLAGKCGGDVKTIMDHYRIDCNLSGVVDGRACRDNNIYVGDRVVARKAQSIGRLQKPGDHSINIGGKTYWEAPNSVAFAQECIDAFVKLDQNGSFVYAILKPCGNPLWSPEPVVVPPPEVKNIQVCELATKKIITIKETEYKAQLHSKNLADCQEKKITVCELATKKIITIKEDQYNAQLHSKNTADCAEKKISVCELATKKTISIDEKNFDSTKHSKNLADCAEKTLYVCELSTKKFITIKESEFDASKHSKDEESCKETPVELPKTGMGDLIGAGLGIGGTIVAGSYYAASRRDLLSALINR